MSIFTSLFRSRDKPQNSTVGSNYSFFMGGTTSGKVVTERSAMQMTAVYSCVRILAEAVAGLPLHLYRYTEDGGKTKAIYHPLYRLLHDEPNPEMSSFVFRETLMTHLLLWGNAYSQIIRNGKNEIIALYPLMPNKMTVERDSSGQLYYSYYRGSDEAYRERDNIVILRPTDVLHIPGLGFDGLVGYSPIAMAKNAIGMAIACEEYGAKFFANGAAPGGVLEHPGTIAEESWFDDDVTPAIFENELKSGEGDITVWINSPGGDCVAAAQIYNMLMDYKGSVTVKIDGIAASAASVIAMAGSKVLMSPVSMLMIHNPMTAAYGNSAEMQKAIDMLGSVKDSILNAYEIKTGMSRTKLSHLMDAETWMDANKAMELGFADEIMKRSVEDIETPAVSMMYSKAAVVNSLMDKITAK